MANHDLSSPDNQKTTHVRLPGFIINEEIGLGSLIKRITYVMGIDPCTSCNKRAEKLNNKLVFSPKQALKK